MADGVPPVVRATIPGAALKRRWVVAIATLVGLLLGMLASREGGSSYQATAMFLVETPTVRSDTGSGTIAATPSPDRYVNDQVATFNLETLQKTAADLANDEVRKAWRSGLVGETTVGKDPQVVTVGFNGTAQLGGTTPTLLVEPDAEVVLAGNDGPRIDSDGAVFASDGTPAKDVNGSPLVIRSSDTAILRDDGALIVLRANATPLVWSPSGAVVDVTTLPQPGSAAPTKGPSAALEGLSRAPDGTLELAFGSRKLRLEPSMRPVILGPDQTMIAVPGRNDFVGVGQKLILLGRDGSALARSDKETIVVGADGAVVALDPEAQVVAEAPAGSARSSQPLPPAPVELDAAAVDAGLSVESQTDSNFIEVHYTAADPETAKAVANAAVEAYENLRQTGVGTELGDAQGRAQKSIAEVSNQLVDVEQQLTTTQFSNPNRQALSKQYEQILGQLNARRKPAARERWSGWRRGEHFRAQVRRSASATS